MLTVNHEQDFSPIWGSYSCLSFKGFWFNLYQSTLQELLSLRCSKCAFWSRQRLSPQPGFPAAALQIDQSQASTEVTWPVWANQRPVFRSRDLSWPIRPRLEPPVIRKSNARDRSRKKSNIGLASNPFLMLRGPSSIAIQIQMMTSLRNNI